MKCNCKNKLRQLCLYLIENHSNEYEDVNYVNKLFNTNFSVKELMGK